MPAANGFLMNWSGAQGGEGIEYFFLGLALVTLLLVRCGAGASIDGRLTRPAK